MHVIQKKVFYNYYYYILNITILLYHIHNISCISNVKRRREKKKSKEKTQDFSRDKFEWARSLRMQIRIKRIYNGAQFNYSISENCPDDTRKRTHSMQY